MTIFLAAALVCVVLLLSLVIWSIRLHRDPKLRIENSSPIDELMPTLAGLTLGTAVPRNSVEVLENGAFFDVLLDRIRSAQKSVHFETFLWKEGALGERVANALSERGAFWEDRYQEGHGTLPIDQCVEEIFLSHQGWSMKPTMRISPGHLA